MTPDSLTPIGQPQLDAILAFMAPVAAAVVGPEEVAVLEHRGGFTGDLENVVMFDLEGDVLPGGASSSLSATAPGSFFSVSYSIAGQSSVGAMVVLNSLQTNTPGMPGVIQNAYFETVPLNGAGSGLQPLGMPGETSDAVVFAGPAGFHLEWLTGDAASGFARWQEDFTASGAPIADTLTQTPGAARVPYAGVTLGGAAFTIHDNVAQLAAAAPVGLPGEPAHAITELAAAALTDVLHAAVAWADSGTDYVSLFDAATDSFGPAIGLDWGGASDLHLVALPDGGFVASWMNGGAYKGEVFAADGTGGGLIALSGDVAGVAGNGNLFTIDESYHVQQYAVDPGQAVSTSDANYAAPDGVRTVFLTGAGQTVAANNAGDVLWSNNAGNTLIGGAGNDVFHLGRGGDRVAGNGGADVFAFAEVPWAGDHITDFAAGDTLDLTILASTLYPVGDPIAAGYLKLADDGAGNAQVWADYHRPDNDAWWLVTTLDGVSVSSLHYANGLIT